MTLPENPSFDSSPDSSSEPEWCPGTVWHYTDARGLGGLVGEKVLRASAMAFMNDLQEMHTGKVVFERLLSAYGGEVDSRIKSNFDAMVRRSLFGDRYRTFIACASKRPNSLTMWPNYTSGVGFAVALDGNKPLLMRRQKPFTEKMISALGYHDEDSKQIMRERAAIGSAEFTWASVVYEREEQHRLAWAALREIEATATARAEGRTPERHEFEVMGAAARVLPTFKDPAFRDEDETRIVCDAGMHVDLMYLKHREGRYGMIPYVELGLPEAPRAKDFGDGPEPMLDLPITGIIVGPTPYPALRVSAGIGLVA